MSGGLSAKIDVIEKDRSGNPHHVQFTVPAADSLNFSSGFDIPSPFFKGR
jgi:hypothetical protein